MPGDPAVRMPRAAHASPRCDSKPISGCTVGVCAHVERQRNPCGVMRIPGEPYVASSPPLEHRPLDRRCWLKRHGSKVERVIIERRYANVVSPGAWRNERLMNWSACQRGRR